MTTLLLDRSTWDLTVDADGNIAVATAPYALAQDAASAIKTFLGECYWDTTIGVPYRTILGKKAPAALLKQQLIDAALTVPGVSAARVFLTALKDRSLSGQVQVVSAATGQVSVATFVTQEPSP